MLDTIKRLLQDLNPAAWRIEKKEEESAELFFVLRKLDTRRIKDVSRLSVVLFREDGQGNKGFTSVPLSPGMEEEEIRKKLEEGYYAASFTMNPGYAQPEAVQASMPPADSPLLKQPLGESAGQMAAALFSGDNHPQAYVNSAEIFVKRIHTRIISSEGTDVSWTKGQVDGEFVAQSKAQEDVEFYQSFKYDSLDEKALGALVKKTLAFAADRSKAQKALKSGSYDLVLNGENLREILFYYEQRTAAHMIYPGYSTWQKEMQVQTAQEGFEPLDLTLAATEPFSMEGIPMKDRILLDKGQLKTIHGANRFCRYLDTEPTGHYSKIRCENPGSIPLKEMVKKPCLWVVNFSDFQMDPMSGYFGGEIRLAYLNEGNGIIIPVTGGSVSGSLMEKQDRLIFTTDRYASAAYEGPYGLMIKEVSVAGESD